MRTAAPSPKNRLIRLQQELVPILRATGSIEGAERYWKKTNFSKGFGRKLACYGFHRLERQSMINRIAFPKINFVEVDAALLAGNKLRQIYALAHGEAWVARDTNNTYKTSRKGLKIISNTRARESKSD